MANLAQFDFRAKGQEFRTRSLLEDLTENYKGVRPESRLALAVWFGKSLGDQDQSLLLLFTGHPMDQFVQESVPLLWKSGLSRAPFVHIRATSVDYFSMLLKTWPKEIAPYQHEFEVLFFDKKLLNQEILCAFQIETEPRGLIKGWYVSEDEYGKSKNLQQLLSFHVPMRPNFGLIKIWESHDFEHCRGVLHIEANQSWVPLSPEGIQNYLYYTDFQSGHPVYFLFEGGSLYQVLRFEVKTAPEYAGGLLRKTRDDRYPEVYLRAMRPSAQSTA